MPGWIMHIMHDNNGIGLTDETSLLPEVSNIRSYISKSHQNIIGDHFKNQPDCRDQSFAKDKQDHLPQSPTCTVGG